MKAKIKSRIPKFIYTLHQIKNRPRASEINREALNEMGSVTFEFIRRVQPRRTYNTLHPLAADVGNIRTHTPISKGWQGPITSGLADGGAVTLLMNRSEHIEFQMEGRQGPWSIPGSVFPIGPPLKWPIINKDIWRRKLLDAERTGNPVNPWLAPVKPVSHPGYGPWGGSNFVVRGAEAGRPRRAGIFRGAVLRIGQHPLRQFFR